MRRALNSGPCVTPQYQPSANPGSDPKNLAPFHQACFPLVGVNLCQPPTHSGHPVHRQVGWVLFGRERGGSKGRRLCSLGTCWAGTCCCPVTVAMWLMQRWKYRILTPLSLLAPDSLSPSLPPSCGAWNEIGQDKKGKDSVIFLRVWIMGPLNQNPRLRSAPCTSPLQALHFPCCLLRGEGSNVKQDPPPSIMNDSWGQVQGSRARGSWGQSVTWEVAGRQGNGCFLEDLS